jgi:rhamnose utilization protein RhaD (predicted bifunctional aldolase and dehydrogenase)
MPPSPPVDPLDSVVQLSNLVGRDPRLVQPGGGNTSIKLGDALLVKGSGTDLRTIGRAGFTRLSLARLEALRSADAMSDGEMMRFMASCMLENGPAPSVETPLHSLLPRRVIAHTHDVATMSLTNVGPGAGERLVGELFEGGIVYVPYAPPGFALARLVSEMVDGIPPGALGLALAHHGLVVWGDDADECRTRLLASVSRIDRYLETARRGRRLLGEPRGSIPPVERRLRLADVILPVVRGALSRPERVVLHLDDDETMLARLGAERTAELTRRGMATPEHLLRAGRLPVWLDLDPSAADDRLAEQARNGLAAARAEYEEYHRRYAAPGERPLDDWAKVV